MKDITERLREHGYKVSFDAVAEIDRLRGLVDALAPFLAVAADRYGRVYGLDGMHPAHYDLLAQTNVRMIDFKRATNVPALCQQQGIETTLREPLRTVYKPPSR